MQRILLTGMSGTGKSSLIHALTEHGYKAIDADYGWSERAPDGDWVWLEDRIQSLLSAEDSNALFLCGCATNQGKFYSQFDHIILLSAPAAVIAERLRTRTNNAYGKNPDELAEVLGYLQTIEPLLRKSAGHEIDTSAPLDQVLENVLQIVRTTKTPLRERAVTQVQQL